jgi:hypothetical protein
VVVVRVLLDTGQVVEEQEDIEILMLQNNLVDYLLENRLGQAAALEMEQLQLP